MAREIQPLDLEAISELSRFLTEGFAAPSDAEFAASDILRWKYLDPQGGTGIARSYVARVDGRIVGHIGICPTNFQVLQAHDRRSVSSLHVIDWLASREHPGVGTALLRKVHRLTETQFGMGASDVARKVSQAIGYEDRLAVPVYQRVLRPSHRILRGQGSLGRRTLQWARDLARNVTSQPRQPSISLKAQRIDAFGDEVVSLSGQQPGPLILAERDADLLNHFLRHPRGIVTGWRLYERTRIRGCALLSVVRRDGRLVGKIADCLLDSTAPDDWHAAFLVLARELWAMGADVAQACGSTPFAAEGLRRSGFRTLHDVVVTLRDHKGLIPRDLPFYLTFLEGDHAYT